MDRTGAVRRERPQQQLHRREIELSGERAQDPPVGALGRNGYDQLRSAGLRIPVSVADDLIIRFPWRVPIRRKGDLRHLTRAGGYDVSIEVEDHELLEVAEPFMKRHEVIT